MIPKSLLTFFLSLQSLEQPYQDSATDYDVKVITNPNPTLDTHYGQVALSSAQGKEVIIQGQTKYPFDSLASGDWDNELIVDGVQITNNATSRLWSLPDAFPDLKSSQGGKKAWGPCEYFEVSQPFNKGAYQTPKSSLPQLKANILCLVDPQGNNFTIKFDRLYDDITWTIGWLVNGRLSAGSYTVTARKDGGWTAGGSGSWKDDQWATWHNAYSADQIDVTITEGIETGLLLLDYLAYGNK